MVKQKRSNLTMCLGMTLYNRSSVEKTQLGLSAAHVLADTLTGYEGMSEIEYPGVDEQEDVDARYMYSGCLHIQLHLYSPPTRRQP